MNATDFLATLPAPLVLRGAGAYVSDATLAKRIRNEIALAVKAGALPKGIKVSARCNPGGHHRSLTVEVIAWEGAVFCDSYVEHLLSGSKDMWDGPPVYGRRRSDARLAPALQEALALIEQIADRHNYDNSRIEVDYFDVGYYLTVKASKVESTARSGIESERDPAFADLKAKATAAAAKLGPKVVRSVCGRAGIDGAGSWCLEKLIKLAERADGRPLTYDKRRGAWLVAS